MTREVHTIDATDQAVGRLATQIATLLRGKHKADYEPRIDAGDKVQVTNIKKLKFTGKKLDQKKYHRYSGYPGGLKTIKMSEVQKKDAGDILRRAVREMLPPVRFRKEMMKRLSVK